MYPCDFYCLDEWKMGRIGEQSIPELANSEKARLFLQQGERKPDACADCRWYSLCHGGCKRDWVENDGKLENYSCLAFKEFLPMPKAGFWRSHGRKRNTIGGRK